MQHYGFSKVAPSPAAQWNSGGMLPARGYHAEHSARGPRTLALPGVPHHLVRKAPLSTRPGAAPVAQGCW